MPERPYLDKLRRAKEDDDFQLWEKTTATYMENQGLKWEMVPQEDDLVIRVSLLSTQEVVLDLGVGGLVYEIHDIQGIHHATLTTAINFGHHHSQAIRGHHGYQKAFVDAEADITRPDKPDTAAV